MTTSYKVKFWGIRTNTRPQQGKKPRVVSHTVRWTVAGREKSSTFKTKGLAESFLSSLRQAAKNGEAFDVETGLPASLMADRDARTWYALAVDYVRAMWPHAAAKTRAGMTEALAVIVPVLVKDLPGRPEADVLRRALLEYALLPADRRPDPVEPQIARAVRWLEAASLPVRAVEDTKHVRAVLEAIALKLDGTAAATSTYRRKRVVFHHVLEYAVELGELSANPLHKVRFRKARTGGEIDRRAVANPAQVRQLLTAVTYVGRSRGPMMAAMFACMYFGGLRPSEAAGLRRQDCHLPDHGWGLLTLEKTRPESTKRYTDTGQTHEERGLKHRERTATRPVPIPPELVAILREHIATYGVAADGRLFRTASGKPFSGSTVAKVWREARLYALTPDQVASPLAARPYDLRHAAVSLWLNAGVYAPEAAERAGHSVEVMLRVYAKCIDGQREVANQRILAALNS